MAASGASAQKSRRVRPSSRVVTVAGSALAEQYPAAGEDDGVAGAAEAAIEDEVCGGRVGGQGRGDS